MSCGQPAFSSSSCTTISTLSQMPPTPSTPRTSASSAWNVSPMWRKGLKAAVTTQKASPAFSAQTLLADSSISALFPGRPSTPRAGNCTASVPPARRNVPSCLPNTWTNNASSPSRTGNSSSRSVGRQPRLRGESPQGPPNLLPSRPEAVRGRLLPPLLPHQAVLPPGRRISPPHHFSNRGFLALR
jgi:hypothetical protein